MARSFSSASGPSKASSNATNLAAAANDAERNLTFRQALKQYPMAILWSLLLSSAIIMEGFDTILLANLFAYEPFKQAFGVKISDSTYELTADWQSGLSNGVLMGEMIGLLAAGIIAERIGYRWTLIGALSLCMAFVFIVFFAKSTAQLLVGEISLGMPWGVFATLTTAYAVEVCPVPLRAYLTTYINACWVFGQLLASIILRLMVAQKEQLGRWGYRIPFGLQWFWPIPIALCVLMAPESPWWLVRAGRFRDARVSLKRLRTRPNDMDSETFEASIEGALDLMVQTNEREKEAQSGSSYRDCLRGVDRRRTEISCMCWVIQSLCGSTFMGYSTYFYEQAGLTASNAYTMSLVQFSLGLIGVALSWTLMSRFGRRTLYLSGQLAMLLLLLAIGTLACVPTNASKTSMSHTQSTSPTSAQAANPHAPAHDTVIVKWAIASLLLVFTLIYDTTVGPICYSLVSEIPSTRLRGKSIVLARICYNISGILTNVVTPRMLNPTAWGWGARAGFFYAGTAALGLAWCWFRLPEPKGRTFAELDELFKEGVPARGFKGRVVEVFEEGEIPQGGRGSRVS
ncbi:sugar transporter [Polyplosphaeria fusca]|uniref:Sugar transporter n=1 Tax=Polyplosphaeria fusca TaxID=682080 RepID=A0A9P4QUG0_9PLEO|nr:sugar transporter [Polyplosphaeria fusca]